MVYHLPRRRDRGQGRLAGRRLQHCKKYFILTIKSKVPNAAELKVMNAHTMHSQGEKIGKHTFLYLRLGRVSDLALFQLPLQIK
jgi:hypothetical protein